MIMMMQTNEDIRDVLNFSIFNAAIQNILPEYSQKELFGILSKKYAKKVAHKEIKEILSKYNITIIPDNKAVDVLNEGVKNGIYGKYKEAIACFSKALETNPNLAEAYCNRGIAKYDFRDYKGAISDYNKAIELNPNYTDAHFNRRLAIKLLLQSNPKEVVTLLSREYIAYKSAKQLDKFDKHFDAIYAHKERFGGKTFNEEALLEAAAFAPSTEERKFFWNLISVTYDLVQSSQAKDSDNQINTEINRLVKDGYPKEMVNFIGDRLIKGLC